MNNVEIRKVSNGYLLMPAYGGAYQGTTDGKDVSVFETFDSLVKYLGENFDDKLSEDA